MMIDVLRPLLCTWYAKWAEQPAKPSQSWNLQSEVKDETTFRYANAEIGTRVVVICGPQATARPRRRPAKGDGILWVSDLYLNNILPVKHK